MTEHLVYALWGAQDLLADEARDRMNGAWVQVNVSDDAVAAGFRLTAFEEPADAFLTLPGDAKPDLSGLARRIEGWRVETECPIPPPTYDDGLRADALAQVAVLRVPQGLEYGEWLHRWKHDHTPIGIADQGSFGYVQHRVLEAVTTDAPEIAAVVEELFPMAALTDLHAFYGSAGDDDELGRRLTRMLESVRRFGADRDIDVVPTGRYRWSTLAG